MIHSKEEPERTGTSILSCRSLVRRQLQGVATAVDRGSTIHTRSTPERGGAGHRIVVERRAVHEYH